MRMKPADARLALFRDMLLVRRVEEKIAALYPDGDIRCPVHLSIGQEAVSAGVFAALRPTDYAISAHRSHAHYINKGGSLRAMFAELYGKATGCCGGVGGSMHLIDLSVNFLGCVPIVGASIPIGVGVALGLKLQGSDAVTAVFFGDGATEAGAFHEALNFAALHHLRVLFVCENNGLSVSTPIELRQWAVENKIVGPSYRPTTASVRPYGMKTSNTMGRDVAWVHGEMVKWVEQIRTEGEPAYIEFFVDRFAEHYGPVHDIDYSRCPVTLYRDRLESEGTLDAHDYVAMCHDIDAEIDDAIAFAKTSAFPVAA